MSITIAGATTAYHEMVRFYENERVHHVGMGENGTVTAIDENGVHVEYDKAGTSGKKWSGIYDKLWFRLHPRWLLHGERTSVREPSEHGFSNDGSRVLTRIKRG